MFGSVLVPVYLRHWNSLSLLSRDGETLADVNVPDMLNSKAVVEAITLTYKPSTVAAAVFGEIWFK